MDEVLEWVANLFPVLPRTGRVTLLFTDVAGFTSYAATRGDRAAVRLLHRHDRAALPAIRRHGGRIVKRLGDGLMVAFTAPADALVAALAMQRAAAGRIALRIGVHAGAARLRAGDILGHDVNVAARIAERALGGQVLVSDAVRRKADGVPATFRRTRPLVIGDRDPVSLFVARSHEVSYVA